LYFSSTCPLGERLKQTPEEEARGKRYWKHYEKTGEFLVIGPMPTKRVAGLMDVVDEDEELNYIDDGTPMETSGKESPALKTVEAKDDPAMDKGQSPVLEPHDPIDLDSTEAERPAADQSKSPPPMLEGPESSAVEITGDDIAPLVKDNNVLQLEKAGALS
jgi:hypothetical protein